MFPVSLPAQPVLAHESQTPAPNLAKAPAPAPDRNNDKKDSGSPSSIGRSGFERLIEQERYRIPFDIKTSQALKALLTHFAEEFADPHLNTPFVVISGGGIVGYLAAIHLRQRLGYNVLVVEKRSHAERRTVLDLKRFTLKEWPPDLIELLIKEKLITRSLGRAESFGLRKIIRRARKRSIISDLATPATPAQQQPIPLAPVGPTTGPWAYPDPARESETDFYETYALTQIRDAQAGLSRYCREIGVHLLNGEIAELSEVDGESVPGIRMGEDSSETGEIIQPPTALPALVLIVEGNTPRLDDGFGGTESIAVDEIWHQRNYLARHAGGSPPGGGSSIEIDRDRKAAVLTQVWNGPDGLQANVSVLPTPEEAARIRAMPAAEGERELDALFERAPRLLANLPSPIIVDQSHETWRSPPIASKITRARNPVHGNVVFLGDSSGLGSPFNSRGANDGATGQLRILMEYIRDPRYLSADAQLRREAENLARARFNDVYRARHGTALDLMLQFGFYTPQQVAEIQASFRKERRMP
ncbi:FAD/NAD(P)-binding protein [Herbaspirillum sp. RV1423]|uniref:NAD(P)-binding protein n=1 Tax=Herbaspirillum sp. RV1423 TaxID=1443993 RepID=UPI0004B31448|nr:FAD/NAD(P)-binding oxidoreductase [Herbaspirillum sp. RV1423]